jgi:predicted nucleotidyltransferase
MATPSKENNFLELILENSPLKEWHFEELMQKSNLTKASTNKWLKKYTKINLLKQIKERNKFPYYIVQSNNPVYYSLKRIYILNQLQESGLLKELLSIEAKTIIIFGSTIKGDWYKNSDIDIFIFGNFRKFNKNIYELLLKRNIELHLFQNKEELNEIKSGLLNNIINGYVLKGQIQDLVKINEN